MANILQNSQKLQNPFCVYVVQGGGTGARMVVLLGHFNHHLNHPTDQGPKSYQDIKYLYMRIDIEKIKQKGIITM